METYAEATSALARAEERISLSPYADILLARLRMLENEALESLDPAIFPSQRQWSADLARLLAGKLTQAGASPADGADLLEDAELIDCWEHAGHALPMSAQLAEAKLRRWWQSSLPVRSPPQLLGGLELATEWARLAPLAAGNIVTAIIIGDRYATGGSLLSSGGLTALGMKRLQLEAPRILQTARTKINRSQDRVGAARIAWLQAIAAGANMVIDLDCRLGKLFARVEAAGPVGRNPSHLRELVELAARRPFTTINLASSRLGIGRLTAHRLINAALSLQLIREVSSDGGYRRFVAEV